MTIQSSDPSIATLIVSPFARIAWTGGAVAVLLLAFLASGAPPIAIVLLGYLGPLAVALWIVEDALQERRTPCFDFGYFVFVTYPFSLVWYCVSTRGWRGWLLVLAVLGLVYAPYVVATVAWTFLSVVLR
ncbi:MAG: hypothetical protein ACR2FY_22345 [Pirellulaceae bacterium]